MFPSFVSEGSKEKKRIFYRQDSWQHFFVSMSPLLIHLWTMVDKLYGRVDDLRDVSPLEPTSRHHPLSANEPQACLCKGRYYAFEGKLFQQPVELSSIKGLRVRGYLFHDILKLIPLTNEISYKIMAIVQATIILSLLDKIDKNIPSSIIFIVHRIINCFISPLRRKKVYIHIHISHRIGYKSVLKICSFVARHVHHPDTTDWIRQRDGGRNARAMTLVRGLKSRIYAVTPD